MRHALGEEYSRVRLSPGRGVLPAEEVNASMLRPILKWIAFFYLLIESLASVGACFELFLGLAQPNGSFPGRPLSDLGLNVAIHLVIVGSLLPAYLFLRKLSQLPLAVTRQSALLTARAAQSGLLAVIGLCALASESIPAIAERTLLFSAWAIAASAVGTLALTLFLRKKFLSETNDQLRSDPANVEAIGQWRKWTITSMVLAMSVGMYGFTLRMAGYGRAVEWSFFACAAVLLFFWGPRLSEATGAKA
jgi:hypothetical protein